MKTAHWMVFISIFAAAFVFQQPLRAEEIVPTAAEHLKAAVSYEQKAAEQERLIQKHEQMKKDYPHLWSYNPKYVPKSDVAWMNSHCDAIIAKAESLKAELLEFAKWHRLRAEELKEQ